ncbi:MAG: hypothetical protein RIS43_828 [Actinomycetota bacterium]
MSLLSQSSGGHAAEDGARKSAAPSPWRQPKQPKKKAAPNGIHSLNGNWAYLFTSPFFILFMIFGLIPVVYCIYIAFYSWDPLDPTLQTFVGLDNFKTLLADEDFWNAVRNTFSIWGFSTFPQMAIAIGIASILRNPVLRGATAWRTLLLIPNITSVLAVALVFGQLFGREYGIINYFIGLTGHEHIDFVEDTIPGHIAIATMITWRWVGYNSLIFLAAMLAIPQELFESAAIDGANRWKTFRYVTLPQLKNTITFFLIVGTIGGLQVFAEPLIMGGAGGGANRQFSTLTLFLFEQAFINVNWGYGAAVGIAITVIVLIISTINFFITRRIASSDN